MSGLRSFLQPFIELQRTHNYRWKLFEKKDRDFIYVRDRDNKNKTYSLTPLVKDSKQDCNQAWVNVQAKGEDDWVENIKQDTNWSEIKAFVLKYLEQSNKGSSNTNAKSHLNSLERFDVKLTWSAINDWLHRDHQYGDSGFRNKLDSLSQIRKAFFKRDGKDPHWLQKQLLERERENHNSMKPRNRASRQEGAKVRAIISKEDAEKYFDENIDRHPLGVWCLAMMLCYGLRNHELFHIQKLKNGFILVPWGLTKSIDDHAVWPLYKSWIDRYQLFDNFKKHQDKLQRNSKPDIRDPEDVNQKITLSHKDDRGLCYNNQVLGAYITDNTIGSKGSMPQLLGNNPQRKKQKIPAIPYDLRHTYAVTMASDPCWSHVSEEETAKAMGHSLEIHRRNYQLWIDGDKQRKRLIENFRHPY